MIRHVVMFSWKDGADADAIASALDRVRALPGTIGNTISFALGTDAGLMDGNHDAVIIADFADAEAFHVYQQHPAHVEVVREHLVPLIANRAAVQLEIVG